MRAKWPCNYYYRRSSLWASQQSGARAQFRRRCSKADTPTPTWLTHASLTCSTSLAPSSWQPCVDHVEPSDHDAIHSICTQHIGICPILARTTLLFKSFWAMGDVWKDTTAQLVGCKHLVPSTQSETVSSITQLLDVLNTLRLHLNVGGWRCGSTLAAASLQTMCPMTCITALHVSSYNSTRGQVSTTD